MDQWLKSNIIKNMKSLKESLFDRLLKDEKSAWKLYRYIQADPKLSEDFKRA